MGISNVISLLSGIALFLFGMALMGDGLKRVAGNKLELILYRLTGSPIKGFLLGAGVTAVIQSSSATSVMIVGFVHRAIIVREHIAHIFDCAPIHLRLGLVQPFCALHYLEIST